MKPPAPAVPAPPPIEKPDIVVPDAGPLISLARAGLLHLLHEAGGAVVVVDVVAHEVTRDQDKASAPALLDWMDRGSRPGSNAPVRVEETEVGRAYARLLRYEPEYRMRNGGETAILEWLADKVAGTDRATIVLYENGRVPGIVAGQNLDADIDVLTTRAFLQFMERRASALPDAAAAAGPAPAAAGGYWERVAAAEPTTNPQVRSFTQRRTARP